MSGARAHTTLRSEPRAAAGGPPAQTGCAASTLSAHERRRARAAVRATPSAASSATSTRSASRRSRSRPDRTTSTSSARSASCAIRCRSCCRSTTSTARSSACAIFHGRVVMMLGPAANHYMTVSHADNFNWREGSMGDLIPLLGDGLLTIDGDYHRRARRIMLPAFHRERIAASHDTMVEETRARARRLARRRDPRRLPLGAPPHAARRDARAVRARPRRAGQGRRRPRSTSSARSASTAPTSRCASCAARARRGAACWRRARRSTASSTRRSSGAARGPDPDRTDVLSMLLEATDAEDGSQLSDREVRDQVMTLLFAGHDTSTSTISFLLYELARHPAALAKVLEEQDRVLGGRAADRRRADAASCPSSRWCSTRRCASTRPHGSARAARVDDVRVRRPRGARRAPTSTTPRGPATACPTCGPSPRRSCPSASRPRRRRSSRRAPTSPSAAARAPASGCASASSRSRRSSRCCCSATGWSCSRAAR